MLQPVATAFDNANSFCNFILAAWLSAFVIAYMWTFVILSVAWYFGKLQQDCFGETPHVLFQMYALNWLSGCTALRG